MRPTLESDGLPRPGFGAGQAYGLSMRVLIVEDESDLSAAVARGLRREGLAVDVAADGSEALMKASLERYDVVVLDRDLPVVHGDEVCRQLGAFECAPAVLMLTAAGEVSDRVAGLAIGADDYLGKPFAFAELVARVLALARRVQYRRPLILSVADVEFDTARRQARRAGRDLALTAKELGVLEALLVADGAYLSAEDLLARVWDENADPFTAAVRVTMSSLRRKLGDPPLIQTLTGVGYRIGDGE
jgi:DNA-binding response OmpR family regulator